jgi:ADP-heptose:LPS heptosyltransferase
MNYLIFRTDRIGDFLITSSLITAIKRNNKKSKVFIVASNKNKIFIKSFKFIDKVFLLKSKSLLNRLKLIIELRKYKFDNIIISDKKNRSILFGVLLNSHNKVFNVSKKIQKIFLNIFYKNVFLDNDKIENQSIKKTLSKNCKSLNINLEDKDFHYLKPDQFKSEYHHSNFLNLENLEFLVFHFDEKWEKESYSKFFSKASKLTDICMSQKVFMNFLSNISKKTSKNIVVTTGTLEPKIIKELKSCSRKINNFLYEFDINNKKAYLLTNESFFSISHLISKSSLFISCHGAFTHIASNYKIKILDIIEKSKQIHYSKITKDMINYKYLYRDDFEKLSEEIIINS